MAESKTPTPAPTTAFSITSLITGITGLVFVWVPLIGFILSAIGVIFGGIALKKQHPGKGLAIAGLVTGVVGVAITGFIFLLILLGLSFAANTPTPIYYY